MVSMQRPRGPVEEGVFVKDQGVDSIPSQKVHRVQPENGTIPGSLEMNHRTWQLTESIVG